MIENPETQTETKPDTLSDCMGAKISMLNADTPILHPTYMHARYNKPLRVELSDVQRSRSIILKSGLFQQGPWSQSFPAIVPVRAQPDTRQIMVRSTTRALKGLGGGPSIPLCLTSPTRWKPSSGFNLTSSSREASLFQG